GDAELARDRPQRRLQRTASRQVELELRKLALRLGERAEEDEMPLDRDQTADAEQARRLSQERARRPVLRDPVVHDVERLLGESLRLLQVAREPARDRDVLVRERRDRAVGVPERPALAK